MRLRDQIERRVIPTIRQTNTVDGEEVEAIASSVMRELELLGLELPAQLIHRDAHPGNMLFEGDTLTGIVDFEMVTRGPRVFDICYCATSILISAFDEAGRREEWPGLFEAIVGGYKGVSKLAAAERRAFWAILAAIELLFIAHGLDHGDVGGARCNERALLWLTGERERLGL